MYIVIKLSFIFFGFLRPHDNLWRRCIYFLSATLSRVIRERTGTGIGVGGRDVECVESLPTNPQAGR